MQVNGRVQAATEQPARRASDAARGSAESVYLAGETPRVDPAIHPLKPEGVSASDPELSCGQRVSAASDALSSVGLW